MEFYSGKKENASNCQYLSETHLQVSVNRGVYTPLGPWDPHAQMMQEPGIETPKSPGTRIKKSWIPIPKNSGVSYPEKFGAQSPITKN